MAKLETREGQDHFDQLIEVLIARARENIAYKVGSETKDAIRAATEALKKSGLLPVPSLEDLEPGEQLFLLTPWTDERNLKSGFHRWCEFNGCTVEAIQGGDKPGVWIRTAVPKGQEARSWRSLLVKDGFKYFTTAEGAAQIAKLAEEVARRIEGE